MRSKDSKPEMLVRRLVHGLGYRYRLHDRRLPGTPDLVFPSRRKVIHVNGCFWHRHGSAECGLARMPKSRVDFWEAKLEANRVRDELNRERLSREGWGQMVVWECECRQMKQLEPRIRAFLEDDVGGVHDARH